MCQIIHASSMAALDRDAIEESAIGNPHGVGVMFRAEGKVRTYKTDDSKRWSSLLDNVPANTELALHFRYATSGQVVPEQAHPFEIGIGAFMHNGVLPKVFGNEHESDTTELSRYLRCTDRQKTRTILEMFTKDNRFLVLDAEQGFQRLGAWSLHEKRGDGFVSYSAPRLWYGTGKCPAGYEESMDLDETPWGELGLSAREYVLAYPEDAAWWLEQLHYEAYEGGYTDRDGDV